MVKKSDWVELLKRDNFQPTALLTLTYGVKDASGQDKWDPWTLSTWQVQKHWRGLVRHLNEKLLGVRYKNQVKHSYFSYLFAIEKHKSGNLHAHAIVDNWLDYQLVHEYWGKRYGFAWIRTVTDPDAAIGYVVKYVVKEAEPIYWLKKSKQKVTTLELNPDYDGAKLLGGEAADWRRLVGTAEGALS